MDEGRKKAIEQLKTASPLEMTNLLESIELYDRQSSQEIIDQVYQEFESNENLENEILKPVFTSVIDGLLEATSGGRAARKKGLTASRVLNECESFSYDDDIEFTSLDGYTEFKNARYDNENAEMQYKKDLEAYRKEKAKWKQNGSIGPAPEKPKYGGTMNSNMSEDYLRSNYQDKKKMDDYKNSRVIGKKTLEDEYTNKKNLYLEKKDPNKKYNDEKHRHQAQPDHIVPLKQIHEEYSHNYALTDDDLKEIANMDINFAVTDAQKNQQKRGMSNEEYIKWMEKRGTPLDEETKRIMLEKQREAENGIKKEVNKHVANNILGRVDEKSINEKYDREYQRQIEKYEKKHGAKPTDEDLKKIDESINKMKQNEIEEKKQFQKENRKEIGGNLAKGAASQAKDNAIGDVILFIVKPIYYELSDIFKNGLVDGVNAESNVDALKIRFKRVKDYVFKHAKDFLGESVWEFVKGFISSLIEGIISLFVGIFKQILKILKEGIKIFVQSAQILFGSNSQNMSNAEKGDAIIKLLGGSAIAIAGIGIEALINKMGIADPWSTVVVTMLSGIASALFMYLLDKIDLFSVNSEKRKNRIIEIFDERINDIKEAKESFNIEVLEILKNQQLQFTNISNSINEGIKNDNVDLINDSLFKMANFFKIELGYSNSKEFLDYMDEVDTIEL